jgi:hypothetical protein
MELTTKVTRINGRWHARLLVDGKVYDEVAVYNRIDIGWACRTMLRWLDKNGWGDAFSSAARKRNIRGPFGQVDYIGTRNIKG